MPRCILVFEEPTISKLAEITEATITLNWTPPPEGGKAQEVGDYVITWSSGDTDENSTTTTDNTIQLDNLISNTEYTITVAARGSKDNTTGAAGISNETTSKLLH